MKADDFLYGAHSGIQKAIRRGDLDLAKTCFDAMWKDSKHRNWLKWRTTVLVEEDAWQMIGEFAQFLDGVTEFKDDPDAEEAAWRKFIYKLVVVPKSKDTEGLLYTAMKQKAREDDHEELSGFRLWLNMGDDPAQVVEDLFEELVKERKMTDYEKAALKLLKGRVYQGGMAADRKACLACMMLVASRGLDEKEVKKQIKWGVKRWVQNSKRKKPRTVNLPWYVFDMHTAIGKFALSVFAKRKMKEYRGLTKEQFGSIWFFLESALIPKDMIKLVPMTQEKLTATDSMWWPILVELELPFSGYTPAGIRHLWKTEMRDEVKNIVRWCMEKRAEE